MFIVFYSIERWDGWEETHRSFESLKDAMLFVKAVTEWNRPDPRLYGLITYERN